MHFRFAPILCVAAALILLSGCSRHDVSGKYLAKFTNGIYWMQLVKTPDNHVTGQFDTLILGIDGKVEYNTLAVTGAADGNNISLLLKPNSVLPFTVTASGSIDGDKLTLMGGFTSNQPSTVVLVRSDASEYEAQAKVLNAQSHSIVTARADAEARQKAVQKERDLIAKINQLVVRVDRFKAVAVVLQGKLSTVEHRYQAMTSKMEEYLKRERQLVGNPKASFDRRQISFAVRQPVFVTNQLHSDVLGAQSDFRKNGTLLLNELSQVRQTCEGNLRAGADNLVRTDAEALNSACRRLIDAYSPYTRQYGEVALTLARLEDVYKQEQKTQEQLVQEAHRIQ